MADLQVYQYDSTKLPYESKTYTTPDMGDLYKTPEKNQPGEWSINSNMQMADHFPKDDLNQPSACCC